MTTIEFLSYLRDQKIQVWADGDQLRYRAPSGTLTPALREELVRRKAEILALLRSTRTTIASIRPATRDGALPLSPGQERIWFLEQLEPGSTAYNISIPIRLSGPLNVSALEQSLNEIVRRHEALRTSFSAVDGQPIQVIAPSPELTLPVLDLRDLSRAEREAEAQRLAREGARLPFDLTQGPLLRTALLWLEEEEHILLLSMHHIISDGWSISVLRHELSVLYAAFSAGEPSPLPELPIQYADYAVWQREWLQGEALQEQLAYWSQKLAGSLPVLELPLDHRRPAMQTHAGAEKHALLSKQLTEAIKTLGSQEGATLFMTLLAVFKVLLYRYTSQQDMIVGSPISGRDAKEVEGLIGYFLNTLILRTDLSGEPSFRQLLQRVRETVLGAFEHQVIPLEELLAELQPERSLSHSPLFQVLFVLQDPSPTSLELPGITLNFLEFERGSTQFDLSLVMWNTENGLTADFVHNTDLFDAPTIERLLGHFQVLLESIVANPDLPISHLPLLSEAEQHQLLGEWNQTQVDYVQDRCVYELFEAQVKLTPEAAAVVHKNQDLTYLELNQRANQLAHYLQTLGVGPEVPVGIFVERSLEMVIGILGILKAGGAYVPLDPMYPQERLAFMLENAQVGVLLTQERLVDLLPEHRAKVVCLDADWATIAQESRENPDTQVTADDLAYVIYTSGSTGRPKGVMIQQRSLATYTQTAGETFNLSPDDRVLQFASISFDTAAEEIFPCLTRGAALVLRTDEMLASASAFLQCCHDWQVSVLDLPTAYWHELAIDLHQENLTLPPALRLVIIGGEKALWDPYLAWQKQVDQRVQLLNTYGPTESTIVATSCDLSEGDGVDTALHEVLIGRPVNNAQAYILDRALQPVPIGVAGELHIGGAGLARGYLRDPRLTAERFIPDPFGPEPGARLYKTGDLARYRPNGSIQFLGRVDHQVKVRGFRVEPGEIEAALNQHPRIREALVVAQDNAESQKRLVAYLVPDPGAAPTTTELRHFLQPNLPEYMVPSAFVMLDALPLTPSGKVDHDALPAPDGSRPDMEQAFVAPRTAVEEVLAGIWADVLGMDQVGVYDNFFELGGHSLLATRIIARGRDAFQVELPVRKLFETPTIAGLALAIEKAMVDDTRSTGPTIAPAPRKWHRAKMTSSGMQPILDDTHGEA